MVRFLNPFFLLGPPFFIANASSRIHMLYLSTATRTTNELWPLFVGQKWCTYRSSSTPFRTAETFFHQVAFFCAICRTSALQTKWGKAQVREVANLFKVRAVARKGRRAEGHKGRKMTERGKNTERTDSAVAAQLHFSIFVFAFLLRFLVVGW